MYIVYYLIMNNLDEIDKMLCRIKEKYSVTVPLREKANHLRSFYQRGLDARTLKADDWKTAWKHLDLLLRAIG